MASLFDLKIVACDGVFYDGKCEILVFPGADGEMAIMNHHEVFTGIVEIGNIRFKTEDGEMRNAFCKRTYLIRLEAEHDIVTVDCYLWHIRIT